ncbi:unnamed protein product [Auanema sp. JU1783]|nr:unnamed protein product [Auanema sp. JU1783]
MIFNCLLLLFLLPNANPLSTTDTTILTTSDPTKPTEMPLVDCYSEIKGQFIGKAFNDPVTTVHCSESVYCQKMTANYLSINGETHVTMKGCDEMSIPGIFEGIECNYEGCFEQTIKEELYNICCCRGELCNDSKEWNTSLHLIISFIIYYLII